MRGGLLNFFFSFFLLLGKKLRGGGEMICAELTLLLLGIVYKADFLLTICLFVKRIAILIISLIDLV